MARKKELKLKYKERGRVIRQAKTRAQGETPEGVRTIPYDNRDVYQEIEESGLSYWIADAGHDYLIRDYRYGM